MANSILKLDFNECLKLNDEEKIYQFLFDKIFELGEVIIETKGIKRDEEANDIIKTKYWDMKPNNIKDFVIAI